MRALALVGASPVGLVVLFIDPVVPDPVVPVVPVVPVAPVVPVVPAAPVVMSPLRVVVEPVVSVERVVCAPAPRLRFSGGVPVLLEPALGLVDPVVDPVDPDCAIAPVAAKPAAATPIKNLFMLISPILSVGCKTPEAE